VICFKKYILKKEKIIFVSNKNNYCIEDLFSKADFNKYILEEPANYQLEKLNSQIMPDSQKLILSRKFFNLIGSKRIQVSNETKNNFGGLFKNIFSGLG